MLEVSDVHTFYGNIEALKGISIEVNEGEVVTLIGSNGAGKSTTLRSISGLTPPRQGSIKLNGREIGEMAPQDIVQLGISQSPEGRHCFPRMTVRENLDLGAYLRRDTSEISSPPSRIEPVRGGVRPEIERSVVDLPAPLEPISVTHSPSLTSSETPLSASMFP